MNEETKLEVKSGKKKRLTEYFIGLVFGSFIAWGGVIPFILGTLLGVWLARKMLNSGKKYHKIIFLILFILTFIVSTAVRQIVLEIRD